MTIRKVYKVKSSAVRFAKKQWGDDWEVSAEINETSDGQFEVQEIEQKEINNVVDPLRPRVSVAEKPCNLVWETAILMNAEAAEKGEPAPKRKEVVEACIAAGVAYGTARTQYQHWFKANNQLTAK